MHGIERSLRTIELIAELQPVGVTELAKNIKQGGNAPHREW